MKKVVWWLVVCCFGFLFVGGFCDAARPQDWLKEAFKISHQWSDGEPYSSDLEADDVFQESNAIGKWWLKLQDNVVVRFSRFLMRMAIVIAVSMLIYTGIKIWLALGDSGKLNAALKDAGIVLGWVFLVLASVAIVYLVSSLMRWSLNYSLFS